MDPRNCVKLPISIISEEQANHCDDKCEHRDDDECCINDCEYEVTGAYVDGSLRKAKLLKDYENSYEGYGFADKEIWMPVIASSLEVCEKLSKTFYYSMNNKCSSYNS